MNGADERAVEIFLANLAAYARGDALTQRTLTSSSFDVLVAPSTAAADGYDGQNEDGLARRGRAGTVRRHRHPPGTLRPAHGPLPGRSRRARDCLLVRQGRQWHHRRRCHAGLAVSDRLAARRPRRRAARRPRAARAVRTGHRRLAGLGRAGAGPRRPRLAGRPHDEPGPSRLRPDRPALGPVVRAGRTGSASGPTPSSTPAPDRRRPAPRRGRPQPARDSRRATSRCAGPPPCRAGPTA